MEFKKYELITYNNYDFVKIDGKLYLIDTGAPSILSEILHINGEKFYPQNQSWLNKFKEMIGIDAEIIGKDILNRFGMLEVDKINHIVIFGKADKILNNKIQINNNLMVNVVFNGFNIMAYLDTGAPIACANSRLLKNVEYIGLCNEPSFNGMINSKKYNSIIEIGGIKKIIEVFERIDGVNGAGIDLIFSISRVANKYYIIDLKNGYLCFE